MSAKLRELAISVEKFPIAGRFVIARGSKTEAVVITVTIRERLAIGRGECVPYARYGESVESVCAAIEGVRSAIEESADRASIQKLMPAGAARNAVDCALWDLEAKRSGVPAHVRAGLVKTGPLTTAFTLSLGEPAQMAEAARQASNRPILKIKLGTTDDISRIQAVREAAPKSTLIIDANEGWNENNIDMHLRACEDAHVALIEQPLPANHDSALSRIQRRVPICADESVHDRASLSQIRGLYEVINIKLDKTGGLTEALALAAEARRQGFGLMVGCMVGTSLAMAPALIVGAMAEFVDLDGPLLLARDREGGLRYDGSTVFPAAPSLWG